MKNMRGMITAMAIDPAEEFLVVGTKKGWIVVYDVAEIINGKINSLSEIEGSKTEIRQISVRDRHFDMQILTINSEGSIKIQTMPVTRRANQMNHSLSQIAKQQNSQQEPGFM